MTVVKARCRLTGEWLPLPAAVLAALGWGEGAGIDAEVVDGVLVATLADPVADPDPCPPNCLCDGCTCGGCGQPKHPGRCPRKRRADI